MEKLQRRWKTWKAYNFKQELHTNLIENLKENFNSVFIKEYYFRTKRLGSMYT